MAILVHAPPSYAPEPPTSDAPDLSAFEPLVKNYYHAKFWASSLKNGWVIGLGTKEDIEGGVGVVVVEEVQGLMLCKGLYCPNSST